MSTVISTITTLLLQSPPNEVNDVLQDLRTIVADDALLESEGEGGIRPALREYNLDSFAVVKLDSRKSVRPSPLCLIKHDKS